MSMLPRFDLPKVLYRLALSIVLVFALSLGFGTPSAWAHRPHDVVTQVGVSPNFAQDRTIYMIVRDNLFKSTNGGEAWQRVNNGIDNDYPLSGLAVSKSNGQRLFVSSDGDGIYKSDDGGISWIKSNNGLENLEIAQIVISPTNPDVAFAAGHEQGLYATLDAGQSWFKVLSDTQITSVKFGQNQDVFAGDSQSRFYSSNDLGSTWQPKATLSNSGAISAIALSPNYVSDRTLFVATKEAGVYRSTDGGQTFAEFNNGLDDKRVQDLVLSVQPDSSYLLMASTWQGGYWQLPSGSESWEQFDQGLRRDRQAESLKAPHFDKLAISPNFSSDGVIFLGGFDGLFLTEDAAKTWREIESLSLGTVIEMAISPNYAQDGTVAVATYVGGLYLSRDQGETWEAINQDLFLPRFGNRVEEKDEGWQDPRRFFDIIFSPDYAKDNTIFTGILWSKVLRSNNQGKTWSIAQLSKEVRGVTLAASPSFASDKTLFVTNQQGVIFRSTDGGKTFTSPSKLKGVPGNNSPAIATSPNFEADKTVFATGKEGIYKSTDSGQTWSALTQGTSLAEAREIQIAISPNYKTDKTIVVGTTQGLYRSLDAGQTWQPIEHEALGTTPRIESVAISPAYTTDRTILVSVRGKGLFKTVDGGQTFSSVGDPGISFSRMLSVPSSGQAIQFSPNYANDQTLYGFGAANTKVYRSTDGGNTWQTFSISRVSTPEPSLLQTVTITIGQNKRKIIKLTLLALLGVGAVIGLQISEKRRWISFSGSGVQSLPEQINYDVPKLLKVVVIALITLRVIFSLTNLGAQVYNADEVRGLYRSSGYQRTEILAEAFRGEILTTQDLQAYQTPSSGKTLGDTITALAGNPEHPPLYGLLARFWMQIWKHPISARILAIFFGFASLPCIYWLCLELFRSASVGWLAIGLLSLSPYHILLAQGARQYSLWTILILISSTLLLRSLRTGKIANWVAYGATVSIGMYSHLFFAFLLIAHGIYVLLFEWRNFRSRVLPFVLASGIGMLTFSPWIVAVVSSLTTIDNNTQWVKGRNATVPSILFSTIDTLGNLFVDFNNTTRIERPLDLLILAFVLLIFYVLVRRMPSRIWVFLLLPMATTMAALAIPDLVNGGARSLQTRYLIPALLPVTLAVAYFLSNSMRKSKYAWERLAWSAVFSVMVILSFASGVAIVRDLGWDYLDQGRTASVVNLELAPIINASSNPLVISDATHSFLLALSYEVKDQVNFQLLQDVDPKEWGSLINLSQDLTTYSDVFVYFPDQKMMDFLTANYPYKAEPVFKEVLYRISPN